MTVTKSCELENEPMKKSEEHEDGFYSSGVLEKDGFLMNNSNKRSKKNQELGFNSTIMEVWDPLVVLGWDLMLMILSSLDAHSVAQTLLVSYGWGRVASSDKIWTSKCEELWRDKAHLPRISKANVVSKLAAYSFSVMDGKRKRITKEDLCDHAWEFHFTEDAPEFWRMLDPYWNGSGPPLRRYFHLDGSQTAEPDDKVWGGHESCYSIVTSLLADGTIRQHYVRINRWPQMYVTRKEDWSWEISNRLCIYRSIPDTDKRDGTGPLFLFN